MTRTISYNEPPSPVSTDVIVSPVEFKLLFTSAERVAIRSARASDPAIDDFFDIVDDPRLSVVNLSLKSTQAAIDYLASKELITEERADHIKANVSYEDIPPPPPPPPVIEPPVIEPPIEPAPEVTA